jgi:hypothetical protein
MWLYPITILPHSARRIRFERIECSLRFGCSNRNHLMHMVGAHVESMQEPLAIYTYLTNGQIDTMTLAGIED